MKRKFISVFLVVILVFMFIACPEGDNGNGNGGGTGGGSSGGGNGNDPRPSSPESMTAKTALQYFTDEGVKAGWNLGNTLDAVNSGFTKAEETAWGNPLATQTLLNGVKAQGFDIVRIPCTWLGHIGSAPDYIIDENRLKRVAEIVNMVHAAGMKAIINIHHDGNYSSPGGQAVRTWGFLDFKNALTDTEKNTQIKDELGKVWTQIANYFKNYGDYLIFETMNEVHSGNWGDRASNDEQDLLFDWKQIALNAIRATGGNNATRFVAVPGLGSTEPEYVIAAHSRGKLFPDDGTNGTNRLIVSVHFYAPWRYTVAGVNAEQGSNLIHTITTAELNHIDTEAGRIKSTFIDKGIAVYYGEWGAPTNVRSNMSTEIKNTHVNYISCVAKAARANGIVPIYWDDGGDFKILERSNGSPKTGLWKDTLDGYMNAIKTTTGPGAPSGGGEPSGPGGGDNGGGNQHSEVTIGNWTWGTYDDYGDGGSSTITMMPIILGEDSPEYLRFDGNIVSSTLGTPPSTYTGGYAGIQITPNATALSSLKSAATISFKVTGTVAKTYKLQIPTSDINDYGYYGTTFNVTTDEAMVTIEMSSLSKPTWGSATSFDKSKATAIEIQATLADTGTGDYDFTIWNLELSP
uniref:Glycoside hydrolase family 5 n=1 Tax=uncultured bacterium contig00049 TaxID=1181534 RepID=A0A806JZH9_9BACT|nr:glycoside hydrolase family 5 [uncultured bacterium contig00049]